MKTFASPSMLLAAVYLLVLACPAAGARVRRAATAERPITGVVRMLEAMLKKSKEEGDTEKKLYAEHKCYCDDEEAQKKSKIEELTTQIELLASQIDKLKAASGIASQEQAAIFARLEAIKDEKDKLTKIRDDEEKTYLAFKKDSDEAIDMAKLAIDELSTVGADQTEFGAAADNSQYMAKDAWVKGFSGAQVSLRKVLTVALATGKKDAAAKLGAFLELKGPFTGTYAAQSGEVVGILKNMRDTFEAELASATEAENKAIAIYTAIIAALDSEVNALKIKEFDNSVVLSENDGELKSKSQEKEDAEDEVVQLTDFLTSLLDICATKTSEYNKRVELRTAEETAIAETIAILNSDAAFEAFGKNDATASAASFVQIASRKGAKGARGALRTGDQARSTEALSVLHRVAGKTKSLMMARIASLLEADNPFTSVLAAIEEMLKTIAEEEKLDGEKDKWCTDERAEKNKALQDAEAQIAALEGEITTLENAIDDPLTGLKKTIKDTETDLANNIASQKSETELRTSENLAYQKNIEELVEAKDLITKALTVLKAYYEEAMQTAGTGFIQTKNKREDQPKDGPNWGTYTGQSVGTNSGTSAIDLLNTILKNTGVEETECHKAESQSQSLYETSMQDWKAMEAQDQKLLADMQGELADKEKLLLEKNKDLAATEEVKASIEAYLLKIKPGCDFIEQNIGTRDIAREEETDALIHAKELIMDTPAYQHANNTLHNETLGDCADICHNNEDHVDCKSCLAKTSVPGYCAGHPGTTGC